MTNVIRLHKTSLDGVGGEARNVQALYARAIDLQSAARSLAQRLQIAQTDSKVAEFVANASEDLERAADRMLDAVAAAIVDHAVMMIVPATVDSDKPDNSGVPF